MANEKKDLTEFLVFRNFREDRSFWILMMFPLLFLVVRFPYLWCLLGIFSVVLIMLFGRGLLSKLCRKFILPSQFAYDDLGLYVTRKEERFYPWSSLQAGVEQYKVYPADDEVFAVFRFIDDEVSIFQGSSRKFDEKRAAAMERIKDCLKVLGESTPAQSVCWSNIMVRPYLGPFGPPGITYAVMALLLCSIPFYSIPSQHAEAVWGIGFITWGLGLWIYTIIPKPKSIFPKTRLFSMFAAYLLAMGIIFLIDDSVRNQNKLSTQQSGVVPSPGVTGSSELDSSYKR